MEKENKNYFNSNPGVYVALKVDQDDKQKVLDFCADVLKLDMSNSASPYSSVKEGMHATVLAAKEGRNQTPETIKVHVDREDFSATPSYWKILTSPNSGKKCLMLVLDSHEITNFHENLVKSTGLKHSFDNFVLHVSVHYDYEGDLPKDLPNFPIKFSGVTAKPYYFLSPENKCRVNSVEQVHDVMRSMRIPNMQTSDTKKITI